jgi:very-short-patch-repair endonuclease
LLRDSQYLARQAFIEFNLQEMFANELFADFQLFVRLVHRSRLPKSLADADQCLLERYYRQTIEQGNRVRDKLRDGVEKALNILGTALLQHPKNQQLREEVRNGALKPEKFYQQLLRLIYRLLFLLVAEERNLIGGSSVYRDHYSVSRLRRLTEVKSARVEHHDDLWLGLQKTFEIFSDEQKAQLLGVAPLNGDLFNRSGTDALNEARVSNADLLKALWYLCWFKPEERSPWQRVNYAQLDVEELGSIYESLLDFHPTFREEGGKLVFELAPAGMERKSTGSYYTPRELVGELIKSALEPVLQERLEEAKRIAQSAPYHGVDALGRPILRLPEDIRHLCRELRKSMTPAEQLLWECLRDRRLAGLKFRRQHAIGHYIADFYCHEHRLIIELEGSVHDRPEQAEHDKVRKRELEAQGFRVLIFRNEEVLNDPEGVLQRILEAITPISTSPTGRGEGGEGKLAEQAILSIKVLDPACGSGHFLLAAARRLATELARIRTGEEQPNPEAYRIALRDVVRHCIYGVDKNPLAVELCKVALWIESHAEGKPLAFLDHRIKCGDSLVGVLSLDALEDGIPDEAFDPVAGDDKKIASQLKKQNRTQRANKSQLALEFDEGLKQIAETLSQFSEMPDDVPEQIREKERRYRELQKDQNWWRLQTLCHLWTAAFFAEFTRENLQRIPTSATLFNFMRSQGAVRGDVIGYAWELAQKHRFFHWELEFPEVFKQGGFDVVLGNPPFLGGLKISGTLGDKYRQYLEVAFAPFKGTADLCSAFYRRAFNLLKPGGRMGMVATNTIGQGDTRESGLAVIVKEGGKITFAKRFIKWPGAANVEVNLIAIHKPDRSPIATHYSPILDGQPVKFISSRLDDEPEAEPKRLPQNEGGHLFSGDIVRGIGFVLEPEEAEELLTKNPRNADCLFPYLNGEDLNSHPEQKPSRYVICFHDWDLERAKQYPDLLRIVEERVKPERERLHGPGDKRNREYWWQFGAYRHELRRAIAHLKRVLVRSRVSELHMLAFVPKGYIYGDATVVFAFDDDYHFALLQSNVHEVWLRKYASTLRTDVRYTPTDCFDTFPFPPLEYERMAIGEWRIETMPEAFQWAAIVGEEYHEYRQQIMLNRWIGLTKTYNLFHNPNCNDPDIVKLRELHTEMDKAILACYGWDDIDPQHDFYQNDRGQTRFTVSPQARREILEHLLDLNNTLAKEASVWVEIRKLSQLTNLWRL